MQNLINQLLNPSLTESGELKPPSMVKRRAANTIKQLYEQGQADLQARLRLEQQQGFEPITLEYCYKTYLDVVNKEYVDANC